MNGMPLGKLERQLQALADGRYSFRSETQATGIAALLLKDHVAEESLLRIDQTRIIPIEYHYNQTGGSKPKRQTLIFDRVAGKVISRSNDKARQFKLTPGLYDKLVYQLVMTRDVQLGETKLNYDIVDGGEIKHYVFTRQGEESITTPFGKFETIKLARVMSNDKRSTTIWSAPSLSYLPVRVDNTDRHGRETSALLENLSGIVRK
jgi:hypothetical protein